MTPRDVASLVDIHNHLVPGVDDGARSVEAVVDSVERMTRAGIRRIVTTPHLQGSLTLDRARLADRLGEVGDAFERARSVLASRFPEVQFLCGQEVLMDVPEIDFSDARLRLAGTTFVLVEWPRLQIPPGTARVLERIRQAGYRPVVAHPERYAGMQRQLGLAGHWRAVGAYLQVNYGSLVGRYGSEARAVAFRLLREGWVDYLASDFHGHPTLPIYRREAWATLEERNARETADVLSRANPARLIEDMAPMPVPPVETHPHFLARLRGLLRRVNA